MSKRAAAITLTEIKNAVLAGKENGATEIEVRVNDQVLIVYRFTQTVAEPLAETREVML